MKLETLQPTINNHLDNIPWQNGAPEEKKNLLPTSHLITMKITQIQIPHH